MAERSWIGTEAGHVGQVDYADNWTGAAVPTNSDDVYIGPDGTQSMTSGLDLSAIVLNSLTVTDDWQARSAIGSSANYLQCGCDRFVWNGTGRAFIDFGSNTTQPTVLVNQSSANRDDLHLMGDMALVVASRGRLTIDSGDVAKLVVQHRGGANDAAVLLSAPTVATGIVVAGALEMNGAGVVTALIQSAGVVTATEGQIVTGTLYAGMLFWETTSTMTACYVYGGKLDATGDQRAKTLTYLQLWGSGQADLAHGAGLITLGSYDAYGQFVPKVDP